MTRENNKTPIRTHQLRQIDVVDNADWLTEPERVLRYQETIEECIRTLVRDKP